MIKLVQKKHKNKWEIEERNDPNLILDEDKEIYILLFQVLTFALLCGPFTGGRMVLIAPYGSKEEGS